jgi:hypothetical protein
MKRKRRSRAMAEKQKPAPARLIGLKGQNFRQFEVVSLDVSSADAAILKGKQGAGKSTNLDLIAWLIDGPRSLKKGGQIRKVGAKRVSGEAEFTNGIKIARSETAGGTRSLKVTLSGQPVVGREQELLDRLFGKKTSRDPLAFMQERDHVAALQKVLGLDFSELDAQRKELYDERRDVGRDRDVEQAKHNGMPCYDDVPSEEISHAELAAKRKEQEERNDAEWEVLQGKKRELLAINETHEKIRATLGHLSGEVHAKTAEIDRIDARIVEYEKLIAQAKEERATQNTFLERLRGEIKGKGEELENTPEQDLTPVEMEMMRARQEMAGAIQSLDAEIAEVEETNRKVRANQARAEQYRLGKSKADEYRKLTAAIEGIDREKERQVAGTDFPIEDLSFGVDSNGDPSVIFQELPLVDASTGQWIDVSTAIMVERHKKECPDTAPVCLIDNGSALDSEHVQKIVDRVAAAGGVTLTTMTTDDEELVVEFVEAGDSDGGKDEKEDVPADVLASGDGGS